MNKTHYYCDCGRWGLHAKCLARRLALVVLVLLTALASVGCAPPPECIRLRLSVDGHQAGLVTCVGGSDILILDTGTKVEVQIVDIGSRQEMATEIR